MRSFWRTSWPRTRASRCGSCPSRAATRCCGSRSGRSRSGQALRLLCNPTFTSLNTTQANACSILGGPHFSHTSLQGAQRKQLDTGYSTVHASSGCQIVVQDSLTPPSGSSWAGCARCRPACSSGSSACAPANLQPQQLPSRFRNKEHCPPQACCHLHEGHPSADSRQGAKLSNTCPRYAPMRSLLCLHTAAYRAVLLNRPASA